MDERFANMVLFGGGHRTPTAPFALGAFRQQLERSWSPAGGLMLSAQIELQAKHSSALFKALAAKTQEFAIFSLANHVIEGEHGIFVPRSMFDQAQALRFEVATLHDGGKCVVVYEDRFQAEATPVAVGREKELAWLRKHAQDFAGRWVALQGSQLVAEGTSAAEVLAGARTRGISRPIVVHVESEELPFGGW